MNYKKILERLEVIECELNDATNSLPDLNINVGFRSNIDGAKCELYHLKDEIERCVLNEKKDHDRLYNNNNNSDVDWSSGC